MAVRVDNVNSETGEVFTKTLLNPSEKAKKYAEELKYNQQQTNDGELKLDDYGYPKKLTKEQRAYRAGYLAHSQDSAMAYCANEGIPSKAKENRARFYANKKKSKGKSKKY